MKLLFGGSFNPVHIGHLLIARDVLEDFGLEEVIFVPAYIQPLKGELLIPPEIRLKALKAAVESEPRFKVWDYELKKGGISYTYQTLEEFHRVYGEEPVFMMGADSFKTFHLWKRPERILELSRILIVSRPGEEVNPEEVLKKLKLNTPVVRFKRRKASLDGWRVALYKGRLIEISSTEIRERLKSGKPISYMVPEKVEEIVRRWREDALQENVQQNDAEGRSTTGA